MAPEARAPGTAFLAATGVLAGLAAGLLGIGGGLIVVPLLAGWMGVPIKRAVGTSLVVVLVTSCVGVATEAVVAPENLRVAAAAWLAAGALAGTFAGAKIVARTPPAVLSLLMAALLVVAALRMSGALDPAPDARPGGAPPLAGAALAAALLVTGVGAGLVATLFGVGGGILAVPLLALLHPEWPFHACRATSLLMIIPTSIAGGLLHRRLDHVDGGTARALVPGALAGAVAGVVAANALPGRPLELLFAGLLVVSAVQLVRRGLGARAERAAPR